MKSGGHIALSILLAVSIFCTLWYSSCSKDACKGVTCVNFGTCGGGLCVCDSGTGGNNCEVIYRNLYTNTYSGVATFNFSTSDSIDRNHADTNNTLVFSHYNDTTFDKMQLVWNDSSSSVTFPIMLYNNTATGSDFTISAVTVDTFTYKGSGSVSSTSASLNLIQSRPNSPSVIIKLDNMTQ